MTVLTVNNWKDRSDNSESYSKQCWLNDLSTLFDNANQRFADISWKSEDDDQDIVYAHKAIIYARAPSSFLQAYLPKPISNNSSNIINSSNVKSESNSTLSQSLNQSPPSYVLPPSTSPAILSSALKFLYTSDDGESFDFLFDQNTTNNLTQMQRHDKMRSDLIYMWRSKLFSDVKITLIDSSGKGYNDEDDDQSNHSDCEDDENNNAVFSAHRAILASRSSYFAGVLSPNSGFIESLTSKDSSTRNLTLQYPPFTPASLHFALGFIYSGTIAFSNRSLDLNTSFEVYEAAEYLDLTALKQQIVAKISEMCNYFTFPLRDRSNLVRRIPRVLDFTLQPQIREPELESAAFDLCVRSFGDLWVKEVTELPFTTRKSLVNSVNFSISSQTLIPALKGVMAIKSRLDSEMRFAKWVDELNNMILAVEKQIKKVLNSNLSDVFESEKFWELIDGIGFSSAIFEKLMELMIDNLNDENTAMTYQTFTGKVLLNEDKELTPSTREWVEDIRKRIIKAIRNRWINIKNLGLFSRLENWSLKEISDELDVNIEDLIRLPPSSSNTTKTSTLRKPLGNKSKSPSTASRKNDDTESLRANVLNRNAAKKGTTGSLGLTPSRTASTSGTLPSKVSTVVVTPPRRAGSLNDSSPNTATTIRKRPSLAETSTKYPNNQRSLAVSSNMSLRSTSAASTTSNGKSITSSTTTYSRNGNNANLNNNEQHKRTQSTPSPRSNVTSRIPKPTSNNSSRKSTSSTSGQSPSSTNKVDQPSVNRRMSTPSTPTIVSPSLIPTHTMRVRKISQPSTRSPPTRLPQQSQQSQTQQLRSRNTSTSSIKSKISQSSQNMPSEFPIKSLPTTQKRRIPIDSQNLKVNDDGPKPRPQSQAGNSVRSLAAKFEAVTVTPPSASSSTFSSNCKLEKSSKESVSLENNNNNNTNNNNNNSKDISNHSINANVDDKENSLQQHGFEIKDNIVNKNDNDNKNTIASIDNTGNIQTPIKRSRSETIKVEDIPTPKPTLHGKGNVYNRLNNNNNSNNNNMENENDNEEEEEDNISIEPPSRIPSLTLTEKSSSLVTQKSLTSLKMPKCDDVFNDNNKNNGNNSININSIIEKEAKGIRLSIGIPCIVACKSKYKSKSSSIRFRALVRYLGTLKGEIGPWVGVEIPIEELVKDKCDNVSGWNDGTLKDHRYFDVGNEKWNENEPKPSLNSDTRQNEKRYSRYSRPSFHSNYSNNSKNDELNNNKDNKDNKHRALFVRPANIVWVVNT